MKILGILPESIGGRLTISSIFDGFKMFGADVVVYDKLSPTVISDFNFDYVLSYDFTGIKFKVENNLDIKTINYFSDVIQNKTSGDDWEKYVGELNKKENYTFYWDRELAKSEKNVFYLPHFVNTEIYKNINDKPEFDVMFAGRLDTKQRLDLIESVVSKCPQFNFCWFAIERHYKDALSRCKNKDLITQIYQGFIDNEIDMAKAINNSKIVINTHSQGVSALNYRTMQTLACERLIISDKRSELDLFDNKIPTYNSVDEIPDLINYYLSNQEEYAKITKYCASICREKYNSKVGVQYILDKIGNA